MRDKSKVTSKLKLAPSKETIGSFFPLEGKLGSLYHSYFVDYASYVVTDRAIPNVLDGLKPVQRRLLASLIDIDDGRLHKAAYVIGQTMKLHPHGDMSIEAALTNLSYRGALLETQGNWGNPLTGDKAAAPRYIEVRLSPFAKEVLFNKELTNWVPSYDDRALEPKVLPARFPMLLLMGAEGIAVGLATKILPHNPKELCDAATSFLRGKKVKLFPDFNSGGDIDCSEYSDGKSGGIIRHRAKISVEKGVVTISELPYQVTPESLIQSIISAADSGYVEVKKIENESTDTGRVAVQLKGSSLELSPDHIKEIFYIKTRAEEKIHPAACVIDEDQPYFVSVSDILERSVNETKELLKKSEELKKNALEQKIVALTLEEIFIKNKLYNDFEKYSNEQDLLSDLGKKIKKLLTGKKLIREVNDDDLRKLLSMQMRRITKFDAKKADDQKIAYQTELKEIEKNLSDIVSFTVSYFEKIKEKYFKTHKRTSTIVKLEDQKKSVVVPMMKVAENKSKETMKLLYDKESGLIGKDIKFGIDAGEIPVGGDVVYVTESGHIKVTRLKNRHHAGEKLLYCAPYIKGDKEKVYSVVYRDDASGEVYAKRFSLPQIILDKAYGINPMGDKTTILLLHVGRNEETPKSFLVKYEKTKGKKLSEKSFPLKSLLVKGRDVRGNLISRSPVETVKAEK